MKRMLPLFFPRCFATVSRMELVLDVAFFFFHVTPPSSKTHSQRMPRSASPGSQPGLKPPPSRFLGPIPTVARKSSASVLTGSYHEGGLKTLMLLSTTFL